MVNIPLGLSDIDRKVARQARIQLRNRFFEQNPVLTEEQVALIARPGRHKLVSVGAGPIRGLYSSPGNFDNALFTVSEDELFRIDNVKTWDPIENRWDFIPTPTSLGIINGYYTGGSVSFAATAPIGDGPLAVPAYLYIADGQVLWCYTENGYAQGTLTATANPANGDVVRMGSTYYQFTTGSVNAGTPLGTVAFPWLVAVGVSAAESLDKLYKAVGATGVAGTDYSTVLTASVDVRQVSASVNTVTVRAAGIGATGNTTITTETSAVLSWGGGTMAGGGTPSLYQIPTPEDVGMISLAFVKSYVVCVPVQGGLDGQYNGRFYWIEPGENSINPLNFATAERASDAIWQVMSFNDKFWLFGQSTVEPWYPSGNAATPMQPFTGITFERGSMPGTAIQVKDATIFVDPDGGVFSVGGGIKRISNPAVEEKIREAMQRNEYLKETET